MPNKLDQAGAQLEKLGIDQKYLPKLLAYAKELNMFNKAYDLVGADNIEDIFFKHILDSLAPYAQIKSIVEKLGSSAENITENAAFQAADVGSGGGLPGIPLAIVFENLHFTLIERMSKRCAFLENCKLLLGLNNVDILNSEAEKAPKKAFDLIVFRAFRPLDEAMTKTLMALPKDTGLLAAYKAKKSKIDEEMKNISLLVPKWQAVKIEAPFLGDGKEERERHLVLIAGSGCQIF